MFTAVTALLAASAGLVNAAPAQKRAQTASITPHESYSSSVGVLGCKINTNRVAYWPGSVSCNDICVKVRNEGREVHLLKIDSSGGAYDISYDAWNYLGFGVSATEDPRQGGGINMEYEFVPAQECVDAGLLEGAGGKLPLTASNSMNYVSSCMSESGSWVGQNYELYNVMDPVCHWGKDETCTLDLDVSNQPSCPSGLGSNEAMGSEYTVWNVQYGTGQLVAA